MPRTKPDASEFVRQAQRVVAAQVTLPKGVFLEWTGQYEHAERTAERLLQIAPVVLGLIVLVLFLTYRDWADAGLMLITAPAALAGGILCQWLLGLVHRLLWDGGGNGHRDAGLSPGSGRAGRRPGAHHAPTVARGRAPWRRASPAAEAPDGDHDGLLWSTGVGSDVIRPMAAPVLGGILIADEVIDLLLPVLFYHVRRWRWQRLHSPKANP
jgi:Cu(I)/Ag(I) efflux system membrane protein CusA/SilA